jgi:hypothetical protein
MSWGVATQNGVSVGLASIVSISCGATAVAPTSGFSVLSASGTPYSASLAVLNSNGVSYTVLNSVLSSNGTSYTPI